MEAQVMHVVAATATIHRADGTVEHVTIPVDDVDVVTSQEG